MISPIKQTFVGFLFACVCLILWCLVLGTIPICEYRANAEQERSSTVTAIEMLQPRVSLERAIRLAEIIDRESNVHGIESKIIVSLIMRESSYDPRVEKGERLGQAKEIGLMQIHPLNKKALSLRPDHCDETLPGAECQIITGIRYLSTVREQCPGSPWRWIGAYGMSRCPTEEQAAMHPTVRRAWNYCQDIGCVSWR